MSGLEASPACNAGFCNNDLRYATREKVTGIWSNGERDIRCTAYGEQAQKGEKAHYSLNSCLVRVHCIEAGHAYHTESTTLTTFDTNKSCTQRRNTVPPILQPLQSAHQTPLPLTCTCTCTCLKPGLHLPPAHQPLPFLTRT